ncbi:MAG: chemotaxis protein CheW [Nitrospirae bacterium]|nr:MAG: chemotaxis protein CheW [Nitrospirota bacterium]
MSPLGRTETRIRASSTTRFLVVMCAETCFALPADIVRGLMTLEEAGLAEAVTTLGVTYPLRDMAAHFGLPPVSSAPESRIILCTMGTFHKGFRVSQMLGLADVDNARIRPLPPHFGGPERKWYGGLFLFQETVALMVHPGWLLGEERGPAQLPRLSATPVTAFASGHAAVVGNGTPSRPPVDIVKLEEASDADDTPWAQL